MTCPSSAEIHERGSPNAARCTSSAAFWTGSGWPLPPDRRHHNGIGPVKDDALLLSREGIEAIQAELRTLGLDGWLLYEFHGLNAISKSLIGLEWATRRGFVLVPVEGEPTAMIHAIES